MHQLDTIFRPRSIAVIGASQQRGKIGWEIVHNIIRYGFRGKVFPVNPRAEFVHSIKSYRSISDVPDEIDMAIVAVAREAVLDVIDECGKKGVRGVVVITAGFKEVSEEGARLERQLAQKIKSYGMRMVGPNCMGIINTDPEVRLNATFAPELPLRGKIGFISQSGALGVTILSLSLERRVGFSMFASVGNKANPSLPGELRKPPALRADHQEVHEEEADHCSKSRPDGSGGPGCIVTHRGAGQSGCGNRRHIRPVRCSPGQHDRRAV
jgi:acyl-CoA synthetase (NDP forming)